MSGAADLPVALIRIDLIDPDAMALWRTVASYRAGEHVGVGEVDLRRRRMFVSVSERCHRLCDERRLNH